MKQIPDITEAIAAKQGNEKWGTDLLSIAHKLNEEVNELIDSIVSHNLDGIDDELADCQFLITRMTLLREQSCSSLLRRAMKKHKIRETNPNYKKSNK